MKKGILVQHEHSVKHKQNSAAISKQQLGKFLVSSKPGVGKLSSEMHLSLWNAISCPRSRQLSLVTFKSNCAILAIRNYKMQAKKPYSSLTIVKLLTPFKTMKHSRGSLEMQFIVYKPVTATLLHSMYFR